MAATLIWIYATKHWTSASWQTPASYVIDSLEMLARLKLSGDKGVGFLFDKTMSELGAPWVADWSAYPMPDTPLFILLGWLAKIIGLIPATNVALLLAHLASVAAFYICSRGLGHRSIFAAGGALLFGFSFYIFHRGLSHYSFALAYVVPAQLLSVWLIGSSRELLARRRWQVLCLVTAVATGMGNPYFGFAYLQLLTFALLYQLGTARRIRNLKLGALCLAAFGFTLVVLNYSSLLAMFGPDAGLLARNYAGTEIYGLRPIELFVPSYAHRWAFATEIGNYYAAVTSLKGELFYSYVGLAGAGGFLVLAIGLGRQLLARQKNFRPGYGLTALWLTIFFMVGGLNSVLALAGIDLFRAGNRYSIYLLAIALFAFTSWATRSGRKLGTWSALAITVPFVFLCLWDQIPKPMRTADRVALARKISTDQKLSAVLEGRLQKGAAVFQLPAMPFLEQPPVHRMTDYELFRPWLYSHGVSYSYGLLASEPALRWHRWVASLPATEMCASLEAAGYAALYLHKAAFPDNAAKLRSELTALDKPVIFDEDDHLVFALNRKSPVTLPDLSDPRLAGPWHKVLEPAQAVQIYATAGWFDLESNGGADWRWAGQDAVVTLWCPGDRPRTSTVQFAVYAQQKAMISASLNGRKVWEVMSGQFPPSNEKFPLLLQPGANTLSFHYAEHPIKPSLADQRKLGFNVSGLRVDFAQEP